MLVNRPFLTNLRSKWPIWPKCPKKFFGQKCRRLSQHKKSTLLKNACFHRVLLEILRRKTTLNVQKGLIFIWKIDITFKNRCFSPPSMSACPHLPSLWSRPSGGWSTNLDCPIKIGGVFLTPLFCWAPPYFVGQPKKNCCSPIFAMLH